MEHSIGIATLFAVAGFVTLPAIRARPSPSSLPSFEAATIKPGTSDRGFGVQVQGRRLTTLNTTVSEIMAFAWSVHEQILNIAVDEFKFIKSFEAFVVGSHQNW